MNIVFLLFDRITALDAVGPYEVLVRLPGAHVTFAAPQAGEIRTDNRALGLMADVGIDEVQGCDLLLVPGGFGTRMLERDERVLEWLRAIDRTTQVTAAVCTGSILLAAAGLLEGRRANTHWAHRHRLSEHGAIPTPQRIVRDGKYATARGRLRRYRPGPDPGHPAGRPRGGGRHPADHRVRPPPAAGLRRRRPRASRPARQHPGPGPGRARTS